MDTGPVRRVHGDDGAARWARVPSAYCLIVARLDARARVRRPPATWHRQRCPVLWATLKSMVRAENGLTPEPHETGVPNRSPQRRDPESDRVVDENHGHGLDGRRAVQDQRPGQPTLQDADAARDGDKRGAVPDEVSEGQRAKRD